ncbi:MAG: hypothetical protein NC118_10885 [Eubacterium sp.]|nr:hypothetical protein [Eubacterium sp.]
MDFKKIKDIVIRKLWGEEGKYGDDYRSLSKQIDNFLSYLKKENSPLQWFPLHLMSDQEIADLICTYINRSKENRLLLNNLDHKGVKYNYSDLIVDNPRHKREMKIIVDAEPRLKDYETLKIKELCQNINIDLVGAKNVGYKITANGLLQYIDTIYREIMQEKELFKCIGLRFLNTDYIEQFIMVCERITYGSLFYFIIENDNIHNKLITLQKFTEMLAKAEKKIHEEVEVARENYKKDRDFHQEYYKAPLRNMDEISIYFVQFLERKSLYGEMDIIADILDKASESANMSLKEHYSVTYYKTEEYDEDELKAYLCDGIKVPNYETKLREIIEFMNLAFERGNYWASPKNALDLKIAFHEIIRCKEKYQRQTAITIMRNMFNNKNITRQQMMFLDSKMTRGYFREKELMREYDVFIRICKQIRNMFLNCYSAVNDEEAYRLIHRTCFEFLYIFGDPRYSGIEIE